MATFWQHFDISLPLLRGIITKKEDTKPSFFRTGYPHPYHLQQQPFQQPRPTSSLYILYTDFRFYDHSRSFFQQECISLNHLGSWLIGQNSMMRFV
ncbi:MAG: hypothetical protein J6R02_01585 [Alistipes sp.]|nr:hypothetical protein [Alistipes sp.]